MQEEGYKDIKILDDPSILTQLELPGDVWNNNPKFRKCIFKDTEYENFKGITSKLLRDIYEKEIIDIGYPECFDITFDFVPRMCELENCSICPFGLTNGKATNFHKVCINFQGKFCPVVLSSCNYYTDCSGDQCDLLKIYKEHKSDLS